MLKEKLDNISVAWRKVRCSRKKYHVFSRDFRCYQHNANGDIVFVRNLYPYMVHPMVCRHYYDDECPKLGCPSYCWNKKYFALRKSLHDARHARNIAILSLFGIRKR